ncbi:DNA topoisomerase (ATP-hydrolyzing) subunit B [Candidatus Uhrbacteria bacterium]|nr:DNA topoisomerase (ATP-hydrolyzing) subunit B [Candidatus Uhrbacteria bacterium]
MASKKTAKEQNAYGAKQITVLEGLDPVRRRPGMYIGTTGPTGLHHLIWEVMDNSFDEAMAGHGKEITLTLLPGNRVSVEDHGRGIPVDIHPQYKVSALELVLTKLHAGGKFGDGGYKVSGGLHGVGVSVVNALSTYLKAEVKREGKLWVQEYARGIPKGKVKSVGTAKGTGTTITFEPDVTVFETTEFQLKTILDHLRQQAYLTKGIKLVVADERDETNPIMYAFYFEGGVASYVRHINHGKETKHKNVFYVHKLDEATDVEVEVALQYTGEYYESVHCFANNITNPEGGSHLSGFRAAVTRELNNYARTKGFIKEKDQNLTGDDVREGLTAVISVKIKEPQFEGQTKAKLGNPEARTAVETVFGEAFKIYLEEHPADAEAIIGKCLLAAQARSAARAARETVLRKGALEGLTLPGKLSDCSSKDPSVSELFIVEGDSAGGCFSIFTRVALTDGRTPTFGELDQEWRDGKQNFCYTIKEDGSVGMAPIQNVRKTKSLAQVVKVTLDDGSEIVCTPDHRFMLRDGSYCEAGQLEVGTSLMPLRKQLSRKGKRITIEGDEMVYDPQALRWIFTHMLADEYNLAQGVYPQLNGAHRHHIDGNKLNNNPTNIIRLTKEDHLEHHRQLADQNLRRPDVLEKLRLMRQTSAFRQKIRKIMLQPAMRSQLSVRAKKQWQNPEYKQSMAKKWRNYFEKDQEYQKTNRRQLNDQQKIYWANGEHRQAQSARVKAHFQKHPEIRQTLSQRAQHQWTDASLIEWRKKKTQEQWPPEFRAQRKEALNKTYFRKAMSILHDIYEGTSEVDAEHYQTIRTLLCDRNLLRIQTLVDRFFHGDREQFDQAVINYNHKVKCVEHLSERMDVYDLEVPQTHNFALASGVFVHNSAKQGRNREHQAILPLKGKILNVERARLDKMLGNNEIKSLVIALGTNIGEGFDMESLRYDKVIIMTDADVDGAHIRTLLLTLFFRYFPELIHKGHIYIAQSPLYRVNIGKNFRYAYSDEEKLKIIDELLKNSGKNKKDKVDEVEKVDEVAEGESETEQMDVSGVKVNIQRYKGLGEMNPDQLWTTTMDPSTRVMKQVTIEDAEKAEEVFDVLMGADVAPRKRFIQTHAKTVKNLDV